MQARAARFRARLQGCARSFARSAFWAAWRPFELRQAVDFDVATAEEHRVAPRVESEIDAMTDDVSAGIAGDGEPVAGNVKTRAERYHVRIDGDDSFAGAASERGHSVASRAIGGVRRCEHLHRAARHVAHLRDTVGFKAGQRRPADSFGDDARLRGSRYRRGEDRAAHRSAVALGITNANLNDAGMAGLDDLGLAGCKVDRQTMDRLRSDRATLDAIPGQKAVSVPGDVRHAAGRRSNGDAGAEPESRNCNDDAEETSY